MITFGDIEKIVDEFLFGKSQRYSLIDDKGNGIIAFKSMLKAEYKSSGTAVSEPIEQNSFATYNKTTEPREFYFEVALQLPNQNFGVVLEKLETLKKGTDLFSFVTPFNTFSDLTLEGYSTTFETTASMLIVGLQCKEVIQVEQGYTNVEVNDATPIGSDDAKNSDNATTTDTGIGGTMSPSEGEQKEANKSIILRTTGRVWVPSSKDGNSF